MSEVIALNLSSPQVQLARQQLLPLGVRVKECSSVEHLLEWLELREVVCVLADSNLSLDEQRRIGNRLWGKNPDSALVLVAAKKVLPSKLAMLSRLGGADAIVLEEGGMILPRIVGNRISKQHTAKNEFRILVVEDLDAPREIICAFLESLGYHPIESTNSATEALTRLLDPAKPAVQCVVTDIRMPDIDGIAFTRTIRSNQALAHLPIIVLTAYGTSDCLADCMAAGATGFLVKPPKKVDLNREVARAIRVLRNNADPRLISPQEVESFRKILEQLAPTQN